MPIRGDSPIPSTTLWIMGISMIIKSSAYGKFARGSVLNQNLYQAVGSDISSHGKPEPFGAKVIRGNWKNFDPSWSGPWGPPPPRKGQPARGSIQGNPDARIKGNLNAEGSETTGLLLGLSQLFSELLLFGNYLALISGSSRRAYRKGKGQGS